MLGNNAAVIGLFHSHPIGAVQLRRKDKQIVAVHLSHLALHPRVPPFSDAYNCLGLNHLPLLVLGLRTKGVDLALELDIADYEHTVQ